MVCVCVCVCVCVYVWMSCAWEDFWMCIYIYKIAVSSLVQLACSMFVFMFMRICLQGVHVNMALQRALFVLSTLCVSVCVCVCVCVRVHNFTQG